MTKIEKKAESKEQKLDKTSKKANTQRKKKLKKVF